jgi:hypothetical protein
MKIKRILIYTALMFLVVFVSYKITYAVSLSKQFAGKITNTKATQIDSLEKANYACTVVGETIEIKPQSSKYPTSYMIPIGIKSSTKNKISINQKIIGKYKGKTEITCIFRGTPPSTTVVTLDTISLYGNSKR